MDEAESGVTGVKGRVLWSPLGGREPWPSSDLLGRWRGEYG